MIIECNISLERYYFMSLLIFASKIESNNISKHFIYIMIESVNENMKNNIKPSLLDLRNFPFICSDSYGVEENSRALHWHKEMEICYIKNGSGKHLINGKEYSFTKGDLFIINNDEIHLCFDDQDLIMQVIMFDPSFLWSGGSNPLDYEYLRPFFETESNFSNKMDGTSEYVGLIGTVLAEIEQEYELQGKGYELMIKSLLLKVMTLIIRHFSAGETLYTEEVVSKNATEQIKEVIEYIEENYKEPITLVELAEIGQMSVPYLCSSFKSLAGVSPIDFVIRKRISEAKIALTSTHKSILSIAEDCGFNSLSNFNHLFKSFVGMSPREYRKS